MKRGDCRPEVRRFALLMEKKLRKNEHKGGWSDCDTDWLLTRMDEEARELHACPLEGARLGVSDSAWRKRARARIADEAADVANFAMMIADVCGALK